MNQIYRMTRRLFSFLLLGAALAWSCKNDSKTASKDAHSHTVSPSEQEAKKKSLSPHTFAMALVDGAHIHIDYSAPSVRGRIIFGGLLPFDEVWQSGAHNATWFETNKDLLIQDSLLKAGRYGFFTIPTEKEWTLIFNSNWEQHGKDEYDPKEDVLRVKVTPEIQEQPTEKLTYQVKQTGSKEATISLSWDSLLIRFKALVQ